MNKITVIQLLNKIANGEEAPKKIKVNGSTYILDNGKELCYKYEGHSSTLCFDWYIENRKLNEKVEIIEEDKEIEYIKGDYTLPVRPAKENEAFLASCLFAHEDKINELIKAVNELKKGK